MKEPVSWNRYNNDCSSWTKSVKNTIASAGNEYERERVKGHLLERRRLGNVKQANFDRNRIVE